MKWPVERKVTAGAALALVLLLGNSLVSFRATRTLLDHQRLVSHTHDVLAELEATLSTMKDAETGERGYIITGQESYLEPYRSAVNEISQHVDKLSRLTSDNPNQQRRIPILDRRQARQPSDRSRLEEGRKPGSAEAACHVRRRQAAHG